MLSRSLSEIFPIGYTSPDVMVTKSEISDNTDVFSFGITLYVMMRNYIDLPNALARFYKNFRNSTIVEDGHPENTKELEKEAKKEFRLYFDSIINKYFLELKEYLTNAGFTCGKELVSLIRDCVMFEPKDRPAFDVVTEKLTRIYKAEIKREYSLNFRNTFENQISTLFVVKGVALDRLGKPIEAIKFYDKALKLDPKHVGGWYNKGNALDDRKDTRKL